MSDTIVTEPKYTPRSAAADFVKSLPQLGVETTPPVATQPAEKSPVETPVPPAEKPTTPPTTPAPATSAAPVEVKIPRTAKDWDAYKIAERRRLEEKETEIANVRKELEEARKAPPVAAIADDDPRILIHKKTADELSERLRLVDITQHPKFKEYYDSKVNAQVDLAKRIVGAENAEAVSALLKLPDNGYRQEKIDELVGTLSPIQQSRIGSVLNSLEEIEFERSNQIEQAKKDYVAYQEKTKTDSENKQKEAKTKAETMFSSVVSTLQNPKDKDGLFIFQKQEGDEEWNKGVQERLDYAKNLLFGNQQPEALMKAALHASALPGVVKAYQNLVEKVKGLEEQVKGMTAAQPSLESRATKEGGEKVPAGQQKGKAKFLDGRGQAADFIKSLNETPEAE